MKPLYEELKQIRQNKGISLEEISTKTKIRLDFLEKIEEGDFSVTPMPYIRAFLREYAEIVGIDPDLVSMRLDNKIKSILSPKPSVRKETLKEINDSENVKPVPERKEGVEKPLEDSEIKATLSTTDIPDSEKEKNQTNLFNQNDVQNEKDHKQNDQTEESDSVKGEILSSDEQDTEETGTPLSEPETTDNNTITGEKSGVPEVYDKRKPLVIEEPKTSNKVIFAIFITILVIAALIILFINRGNFF
ncbi:MAG TPA: hypothetical protein ENH82_09310 [bacterium]|nr:hypothetical protein [bacterium]